MAKSKKNTDTIKEVRNPFTNKLLKEVWVTGKGVFRRNTTYKTYNSIKNNSLLTQSDINNINWDKSK